MTGGSPGSPHPGMAADKYISSMYGERSKPRENVRPSGKAVSFRVLLSRVFSRLSQMESLVAGLVSFSQREQTPFPAFEVFSRSELCLKGNFYSPSPRPLYVIRQICIWTF